MRIGKILAILMIVALSATSAMALSGSGGGGSSFNAAAPGAIGGTTPSTGNFTRLQAAPAGQAFNPSTDGDIIAGRSTSSGLFGFGNGNVYLDYNISNSNAYTFVSHPLFVPGLNATAGGIINSSGGTAPTLTAGCNGAGSSVAAGSTNNRGQITTQTAASTTCTITWSASATWPQAPFCVFMGTPGLVPGACGTATCVVSFTSVAAATPINYLCM